MRGLARPLAGCTLAALTFVAAPNAAATTPATDPASRALALEFIDSALAEGRLTHADELLARARMQGDGPDLQLRAAELLAAAGRADEAARAFEALSAIEAVAAKARTGAALLLLRQGRMEAAEAQLRAAVALEPAQPRAWNALGVIADRRRDWPAAEAAYARALALAPGRADILNNRGWSRLLQGRHAEAEADLVAALQLAPALAVAETNLRLARALQGRYAEAFAGASRETLARDLNTVGFGALARGDLALAETYFARAIEASDRYDRTAEANLAYLEALRADTRPRP